MIENIPILTITINPQYDGILLFNFFAVIFITIVFHFRGRIDEFLVDGNIRIDSMDIINVSLRVLAFVNIGFFVFQYFTQDFFYVDSRIINYYGQ